ncbi:hypothetical protein PC110_g16326 [Phytophthora cactorum]|uniref:PiggyBac transposable element-derived protein domain-containing protein n=1 Tax=Phytophthora cactorum TaxID=29920 RepID=A0A329RRC2_9STRA|nr:hypothetical protein PC110_g16326 [Phytophthora cactorum]
MLTIEVYCGAKQNLRTPVPNENNTGEAGVIRNMSAFSPASSTSPWRLVITDRTSVKLALELLHGRMYLTGTTQTDRTGYAKDVVTKKEEITVNGKRVQFSPSRNDQTRGEHAISAHYSGNVDESKSCATTPSGGSRKVGGEIKDVPAPKLVQDYHRWMGGVDVHDQLRMKQYSIKLRYKTKKVLQDTVLGATG